MSTNQPLFDKAVLMLRRGSETTEVSADLNAACEKIGIDSYDLAIEARVHLEKIQLQAWEEALQLSRDGADLRTVTNRLIEQGFGPFDAEQVAFRAQKAAEVAS